MSRFLTGLLVGALVFVGTVCSAQPAGEGAASEGMGLALCIGINGYTLMEEMQFCREDAEGLGEALDAGGYRIVEVLLDNSRWENRATLANIRSLLFQLTSMARPQDGLLVFFAGHAVTVNGKPCLVPVHGDEDVALPFEWVREQMAQSKAGSKLLILDVDKGAKAVADYLAKVPDHKGLGVLLSTTADEASQVDANAKHRVFGKLLLEGLSGKADANNDKWVTQGELLAWLRGQMKGQTPRVLGGSADTLPVAQVTGTAKKPAMKPGHGRVRFVMHRKMVMDVWGTSRELWKWDGQAVDITFPFKRDTHEIIYTAELPAGEYWALQEKWEHKTSAGYFTGGPYDPMPNKLRVVAGKEHELKQFNQQEPLSPYGTGILCWDGERVMHIHSLTKKRLIGLEIEKEYASKPAAFQVRTPLIVGSGQRKAKLYAMALDQFKKALLTAREIEMVNGLWGNRVLIAEAANETAFLLATARDDTFRNPRKALGLAREAAELATEMQMDNQWTFKNTLAAALAENGKFDEAVKTMNDAIAEAKNAKPVPLAPYLVKELEDRLKLYEAKQPCRE